MKLRNIMRILAISSFITLSFTLNLSSKDKSETEASTQKLTYNEAVTRELLTTLLKSEATKNINASNTSDKSQNVNIKEELTKWCMDKSLSNSYLPNFWSFVEDPAKIKEETLTKINEMIPKLFSKNNEITLNSGTYSCSDLVFSDQNKFRDIVQKSFDSFNTTIKGSLETKMIHGFLSHHREELGNGIFAAVNKVGLLKQ